MGALERKMHCTTLEHAHTYLNLLSFKILVSNSLSLHFKSFSQCVIFSATLSEVFLVITDQRRLPLFHCGMVNSGRLFVLQWWSEIDCLQLPGWCCSEVGFILYVPYCNSRLFDKFNRTISPHMGCVAQGWEIIIIYD